jgi:ParB-like chromosome segregation protein Spo0J
LRSLRLLLPYARNSQTHSEGQIAQVAASIREFGWTHPILVDGEGTVIAGHAWLLAAKKLGASTRDALNIRQPEAGMAVTI